MAEKKFVPFLYMVGIDIEEGKNKTRREKESVFMPKK